MKTALTLLYLLMLLPSAPMVTLAQDGTSSQQATLAAYQTEQTALFQERQALIAQGASQAQLQAWRQQNASRFAAQEQFAQTMSAQSATQPAPLAGEAVIPAGASPTLAAFLTARATLANARAQIHNQLVQSLPANATAAQLDQTRQQEKQLFQQQYGAELQQQAMQAQALAQELGQPVLPAPAPFQIPADATPRTAAYLTARDQMIRSRVQLLNQYATADPATRQAALEQWRQQNVSSFQQVQQLAEALASGQ